MSSDIKVPVAEYDHLVVRTLLLDGGTIVFEL